VAADWHELMIMQHTIDHIGKQVDPWFTASGHTTTPVTHTGLSPRIP